jgi:hypothetical protein
MNFGGIMWNLSKISKIEHEIIDARNDFLYVDCRNMSCIFGVNFLGQMLFHKIPFYP